MILYMMVISLDASNTTNGMLHLIYTNQATFTKFRFQIIIKTWKIFEVIRRALITKFTLDKEIIT